MVLRFNTSIGYGGVHSLADPSGLAIWSVPSQYDTAQPSFNLEPKKAEQFDLPTRASSVGAFWREKSPDDVSAASPERRADPYNSLPGLSVKERNLLYKLYPNGLQDAHLKQGHFGDCYLVSVLHAFRQLALAPYFLVRMIKEVKEGWDVTLPGNGKTIRVTVRDIKTRSYKIIDEETGKEKTRSFMSGDLGDKILERAIARDIKEERLAERAYLATSSRDPLATVAVSAGGRGEEVYERLFGEMASIRIYGQSSSFENQFSVPYSFLKRADLVRVLHAFFQNPADTILYAATRPSLNGDRDYVDPQRRFPAQHAYIVSRVNANNETLTIVNPHDTRNEYHLSYDEFFKFFSRIELAELIKSKVARFINNDLIMESIHRRDGIDGSLVRHIEYSYSIDGKASLKLNLGKYEEVSLARRGSQLIVSRGGRVVETMNPGSSLIIGRNLFSDMDSTVSRDHLKVVYQSNGSILLEDMGSANGTTVTKVAGVKEESFISLGIKVREGRATMIEKLEYQLRAGLLKTRDGLLRRESEEFKKQLRALMHTIYRMSIQTEIDDIERMLIDRGYADYINRTDAKEKKRQFEFIGLGVKVREGVATPLEELIYCLEAASIRYKAGRGPSLIQSPEILARVKQLELKIVKKGTRAEINEAEEFIRSYGLKPNF